MRLTREVLRPPGTAPWRTACAMQVDRFCALYPGGAEPTIEVLTELHEEGLVWWLLRLLSLRGSTGVVAFAVWCADPDGTHPHLDPARRWISGEDVPIAELRAEAAAAAAVNAASAEAWAAQAALSAAAADAWAAVAAAAAAMAAQAARGRTAAARARAAECGRHLAWISAALMDAP